MVHMERLVQRGQRESQRTDKAVAYRSWLGFGFYFKCNANLLEGIC